MTSASSKAIPFVVIAIVVGSIGVEVIWDTEVDLESFLPLLVPLGITGAAKSAIESAAKARKALPKNIEDIIREEIKNKIPADKSS